MKTIKLFLYLTVFCPFLYCQKSSDSGTWGHFGYDNCYTSYNPHETIINEDNITQLKRLWGVGCDDAWFSVIWRTPAIYNGKLYTSNAGGNLKAYDISSGAMQWEYGNSVLTAPQPAISNQGTLIYLEGVWPSYLYRVNPINGQQLWKAPIGFNGTWSSTVVTIDDSNHLVYIIDITGLYGSLYAINDTTGKIAWYKSEAKDSLLFQGNYVLAKDDMIYLPSLYTEPDGNEWFMRGINPQTEKVEITYERPDSANYHEPTIYSICNNKLIVYYYCWYGYEQPHIIAAYNLDSEKVLWEKQYGNLTGEIACNPDKDIIYYPTDPFLYAIDVNTGEEIWRYTGYNEILTPSIANGIVYFISGTSMWALDEDTGEELFYFDLGYEGEETSQVVIADGKLYFSGNGGTCDLFVLGFDSSNPVEEDVSSLKGNIIKNIYMQNNSVLVIELECSPCTSFTIEMYDMLGKVIKNISFNEYQDHKISTDFTNGPGMYICLVITKSGTYAKKFVLGN